MVINDLFLNCNYPNTKTMNNVVVIVLVKTLVLLKQLYDYISCMCMCGDVFVCLNMLVKLIGYFSECYS